MVRIVIPVGPRRDLHIDIDGSGSVLMLKFGHSDGSLTLSNCFVHRTGSGYIDDFGFPQLNVVHCYADSGLQKKDDLISHE